MKSSNFKEYFNTFKLFKNKTKPSLIWFRFQERLIKSKKTRRLFLLNFLCVGLSVFIVIPNLSDTFSFQKRLKLGFINLHYSFYFFSFKRKQTKTSLKALINASHKKFAYLKKNKLFSKEIIISELENLMLLIEENTTFNTKNITEFTYIVAELLLFIEENKFEDIMYIQEFSSNLSKFVELYGKYYIIVEANQNKNIQDTERSQMIKDSLLVYLNSTLYLLAYNKYSLPLNNIIHKLMVNPDKKLINIIFESNSHRQLILFMLKDAINNNSWEKYLEHLILLLDSKGDLIVNVLLESNIPSNILINSSTNYSVYLLQKMELIHSMIINKNSINYSNKAVQNELQRLNTIANSNSKYNINEIKELLTKLTDKLLI